MRGKWCVLNRPLTGIYLPLGEKLYPKPDIMRYNADCDERGDMMRFRIEFIPKETDEEIVIRCHSLDENVKRHCEAIESLLDDSPAIVYYKDDMEFYLPSSSVLFFETDGEIVYAHTKSDMFKVNYRLYELEAILPPEFSRISKSTVANSSQILSLSKNISSSASVQFFGTHKQVFVSRLYFKSLKQKLSQRRR